MLYSNYASASPADIQRKREIAQRLLMNAQQTQPQTIGEGLGAVGDYIYAGRVGRAADEKDKALRDKVAQALSPITGGGQPVAPATPGMPSASVEPVQITNIPPPGYSDSVTVGGDGMDDIAPPAQMPQQRQPQMQSADDGRMDFAEVDTETLRRTYEKIAADPDLVDAIDFKRPGFFKRAGEELQRRYEYQQGATDREYKRLQTQKLRDEINNPTPEVRTIGKRLFERDRQTGQWIDVTPGGAEAGASLDGEDFKRVNDMIEKSPGVSRWREVEPAIASMYQSLSDPSAISDLDFVYGVAKILDPTSVVRESEAGMVLDSTSLPTQLLGRLNKLLNGQQRFDQKTRAELFSLAHRRAEELKQQADATREHYLQNVAPQVGLPTTAFQPLGNIPKWQNQDVQRSAQPPAQQGSGWAIRKKGQ